MAQKRTDGNGERREDDFNSTRIRRYAICFDCEETQITLLEAEAHLAEEHMVVYHCEPAYVN